MQFDFSRIIVLNLSIILRYFMEFEMEIMELLFQLLHLYTVFHSLIN